MDATVIYRKPRKANMKSENFHLKSGGVLLLVTVGLGILGASASLAQQKGEGPRATPVKVDAVKVEPHTQTIPLIGRFVARQRGDVANLVSGAVIEMNVEVGDRVKRGDVIALIDRDRLGWQRNLQRAEVSTYSARVETKRARIKLLQKELARISSLKQSPAFSRARLDDKEQEILVAKSEMAEAQAGLRKATAELRLIEIDHRNAEILAPFDGVVTRKHTSIGSHLSVGAKVATLIDDRTLEIEADVPSLRVNGLTEGTEVAGLYGESEALITTVRAIVPEENPQTRTRAVRFTPMIHKVREGLAANQSVTLYLPFGESKDVLTVHKDAILNRRGMKLVVVPAEGKATFRPVTLGDAVGNRFVVLKGLQDGEVVVIRGNERLRPKQAIRYDGMPKPEPKKPENAEADPEQDKSQTRKSKG